jgi:hypothetical protein
LVIAAVPQLPTLRDKVEKNRNPNPYLDGFFCDGDRLAEQANP